MRETWSLISEEHRILSERVQSLRDAAQAPIGGLTFRAQLIAVVRDIRDHFCNEEAAMRAFGAPEAAHHAAEHCRLVEEARALLVAPHGSRTDRQRIADQLSDRLGRHGLDADARLDAFLRAGIDADVA